MRGKSTMEYIVQGRYERGWDDLTFHDTRKAAEAECAVYDANVLGVQHRVIARRTKVIESK
jgi:hypothetical protein